MYLGRARQGDWVTVFHSKQCSRSEVVVYSSGHVKPARRLNALEMPLTDIPDWSNTHRTTTWDSDGNPTTDPPLSNIRPYIQGYRDPTLTVFDKDGNLLVDAKTMYLFDSRLDPGLFATDLFIGSDIPEGTCVFRTEYVAEHVSYKHSEKHVFSPGNGIRWFPDRGGGTRYVEGQVLDTDSFGTYANIHYLEILPSGDPRGAYLNSYLYERPQASFLLGQYDSDTLDFRKNPRA